jgi:hypothetical protein
MLEYQDYCDKFNLDSDSAESKTLYDTYKVNTESTSIEDMSRNGTLPEPLFD